MATPIDWPSSGVKTPSEFEISPIWQSVGADENPYTGGSNPMLRWQKWHATAKWGYSLYDDFLGLFGHLAQADGGEATFQVPLWSYTALRGARSGTVTLSGAHAAGATSLTLTGGSGSGFGRGDWVQVNDASNVPRVYAVVSTEAAGVIKVRPGLRAARAGGEAVIYLDGTVTLLKETMELVTPTFAAIMPSPSPGIFQPFSLEFVSALRSSWS